MYIYICITYVYIHINRYSCACGQKYAYGFACGQLNGFENPIMGKTPEIAGQTKRDKPALVFNGLF